MHVWAYDHYSLGLMWTTEHPCTVSKEISPGTGYRDGILLPLVLPALQAMGQGAVLQQRPSQCNLCCYRLPAEAARHPDGLASTITLSQSHRTLLGCAWATNASHPPPDVLRFCQETEEVSKIHEAALLGLHPGQRWSHTLLTLFSCNGHICDFVKLCQFLFGDNSAWNKSNQTTL